MQTSRLIKLYYKLTSFIPRPMPKSKEDIEKLKSIFIKYFDLPDDHQVWYTVFANIGSTKAHKTTISYLDLSNIAKRLDINRLLQDQKQLEYQAHLDKLGKEKKNEEEKEPTANEPGDLHVQQGTLNPQNDLPSLPEP